MNKEIKEILEYMKEISECEYTTDWFEINFSDAKRLYNYITNLQEENDKLKIILQGLVNQQFEENCKNAKIVHIEIETKEKLQKKIDKAIEYIDNSDILDIHYKNRHDLLNILQGEDNE